MHAKINGISMCLSGHYRCGYHSDSYGSDFVKIRKALGVFLLSDWYLFCNLARSFHRPISSLVFFSFLIDLVGGHATILSLTKMPPRSRRPVAKETREDSVGRCLRGQPVIPCDSWRIHVSGRFTSRSILITRLALFIFQLCSSLDFILILRSFLN